MELNTRTQNQINKPGSRHSTSTKVNRCLRSTSSDFKPQRKSEPVRILINGRVTPVTLFADGVLRWSERGQRSLIVEKEVLGFAAEGPKIGIRALVEDGDGICCVASRVVVVRKDLVFKPLSEDSHRLWCQKLRERIDSLGRPKRLFVFVNPFGGSKSASKVYAAHVKPLLQDANIQFTLQGTGNGMAKSLLNSVGEPCTASNAILDIIRARA